MEKDRIDFTEILNLGLRFPKEGDTLFKPSSAWMGNATLADRKFSHLVLMTDGYKKGADTLVAKASSDRGLRDFLVYPVVFCYRHFVELSLKYIIASHGPTVGVQPNWTTHSLEELWTTTNKVLDGFGVEKDEMHAAVCACIEELSKADPLSFKFRYPTDRNGEALPFSVERFDLVQLRDVVEGMSGYFGGLDGYLSELKNAGP